MIMMERTKQLSCDSCKFKNQQCKEQIACLEIAGSSKQKKSGYKSLQDLVDEHFAAEASEKVEWACPQ